MKILVIEDSMTQGLRIKHLLYTLGHKAVVVESLSKGRRSLSQSTFDLILCDLTLPDSDMGDTLKWISEVKDSGPNILITTVTELPTIALVELNLNPKIIGLWDKSDINTLSTLIQSSDKVSKCRSQLSQQLSQACLGSLPLFSLN